LKKKTLLQYEYIFSNFNQEEKIGKVFRRCAHLFFWTGIKINHTIERKGCKSNKSKLLKISLCTERLELNYFSSATLKKIKKLYEDHPIYRFLKEKKKKQPISPSNYFQNLFLNEYGFLN